MHAESSPSKKKNVVMKDLHADAESHSAPHSSGCPTAQGLISIRQTVVPHCKDNHVMLRNTKAFVVDANVQNMEAAGESANEILKIPPPSMSIRWLQKHEKQIC